MDRGLLDAAEFNNATSDRVLGFPDVAKTYMIQSFHQRVESFEILFNKGKYDALPAELQAVLRHGAEASSAVQFRGLVSMAQSDPSTCPSAVASGMPR